MSPISLKAIAARKSTRPSVLDLVVARFDREHDDHVTPIVGCYACLHNEPREARARREVRIAA